MLSLLGFSEPEKYVLFSTLPAHTAYDLSKKMRYKTNGESFSVIVPISSVGGKETMNYINGNVPEEQEFTINYKYDSELIVVVANRGYVDMVMNVARRAAEKEKRNDIMHAIMTEAGSTSKAQSVLFSLPAKQCLD